MKIKKQVLMTYFKRSLPFSLFLKHTISKTRAVLIIRCEGC